MAEQTVKDFLGHPCRTSEAFERWEEHVAEARKDAAIEPRRTARQLGICLMEADSRLVHLAQMLEACEVLLEKSSDSDKVLAVLNSAREYAWRTGDLFSELAGVSLASIEQGGLWKRGPVMEVLHG